MERMTAKCGDGSYAVALDAIALIEEGGFAGPAVERLAAFENAAEVAQCQLARAAERLDELKAQGRLRSAAAQQLLAQKLTYSTMLHMMGVEEDTAAGSPQ